MIMPSRSLSSFTGALQKPHGGGSGSDGGVDDCGDFSDIARFATRTTRREIASGPAREQGSRSPRLSATGCEFAARPGRYSVSTLLVSWLQCGISQIFDSSSTVSIRNAEWFLFNVSAIEIPSRMASTCPALHVIVDDSDDLDCGKGYRPFAALSSLLAVSKCFSTLG